ncbi:MAG: anaerobic ribonucleoside-triphosphate reductase activating protein [Methanomicrobiaceae archaeon]|nr:anaerobic ribonucleoside-triphosphate reductase activating protein [Methanomicrobiaceae archaeon]
MNFGGFVPLSTVDWPGWAVCTVFLRGCPVRCHYCHNRTLQTGEDRRSIEEVTSLIRSSRLLVSGVVFSGGEPTMQKDPLFALAKEARGMDLKVGVQTNGVFPETLELLIGEEVVDKISLDIKTRWEHYHNLLKVRPDVIAKVKRSLALCREAYSDGRLAEFEVVNTLFRGRENDVKYIAKEADGVDFVLQQGVEGDIPPLSFDELKRIADKIGRKVRIRTREDGEVVYEKNRIIIAESIVLTDIMQARRST